MDTDYGKRIEQAILAVQQMHEDTVKLIRAVDKTLGRAPILERITDALKFTINGKTWMVEGMYRHYPIKDTPDVAEGLNVAFSDHPSLQEPLLIAGRVEYEFSDGANLEQTLRENGKRQTNTRLTGRVHGADTCQTRSAERDGRSSSLISSADGQNILQVYLKTGRYAAQSLRQDASRLKAFLI